MEMKNQFTLENLLCKDKLDELLMVLQSAHRENASQYFGTWCPETGFAGFVEIIEGKPAHWQWRGPFTEEMARGWIVSQIDAIRHQQWMKPAPIPAVYH